MVTMQPPIWIGTNSLKLVYSSDLETPTFYIYIDGLLVATTTQTEYIAAVNSGDEVIAEILDDPDAVPMQVFPGRVRLGWFAVTNTNYYRIDEYVESEWRERARITDNGGYMQWQSRFLEDCQSHLFKITPIGTNGNEGDEKQFTILMVRHPDTPDVSFEYSNTTKEITITEN